MVTRYIHSLPRIAPWRCTVTLSRDYDVNRGSTNRNSLDCCKNRQLTMRSRHIDLTFYWASKNIFKSRKKAKNSKFCFWKCLPIKFRAWSNHPNIPPPPRYGTAQDYFVFHEENFIYSQYIIWISKRKQEISKTTLVSFSKIRHFSLVTLLPHWAKHHETQCFTEKRLTKASIFNTD